MEKVQRKKNVVVYNLPESEEEQARDRYKNTTYQKFTGIIVV